MFDFNPNSDKALSNHGGHEDHIKQGRRMAEGGNGRESANPCESKCSHNLAKLGVVCLRHVDTFDIPGIYAFNLHALLKAMKF